MDVHLFNKLHKRHKHKFAGALAAAGVGLIIFPEPVVSNAIGTFLILLALVVAFTEDRLKGYK